MKIVRDCLLRSVRPAPQSAGMRFGRMLALMLFVWGKISAVHYGESREDLLRELGRPTSALMKGDREILLYPNGGRIELLAGKVVFVKGIEVTDGPVAVTVAPNEVASSESKPVEPAPEVKSPEEVAADAQSEAERAKFEKALEDLSAPPPAENVFADTAFSLVTFLIGLAVKCLMMVAALKLTCKYWAVEIAWSGLLIAALADTGVRAVILLVTEELMGMPSAFYADEAIGAIVLVLVLKKVSFNQSTAQAVQITMTSKVFSIVVGSFLTVVILRALN